MTDPATPTTSDNVSGCLWALASPLITGWVFMLAVGVVHGSWWPAVPTIGYLWAVVIPGMLRAVFIRWTPSAASLAANRVRRQRLRAARETRRQHQKLIVALGERAYDVMSRRGSRP